MHSLNKLKFIFAMTTAFMVSSLAVADEPPEVTEEGLLLVKDSKLALVYAAPGANLEGYKRVILLEPLVAFKKNWRRDQNRSSVHRISENDMQKIQTRLAAEFSEVFAEVLQENDGYEIVEEVAADVLTLRPAIINLDVTAPDIQTSGRSRSYADNAGEMTLYLEAYDSQTNALIAKALDHKRDRNRGYMTWQTSVGNTAAAKRILRGWAQVMRDALDEANATLADKGSD